MRCYGTAAPQLEGNYLMILTDYLSPKNIIKPLMGKTKEELLGNLIAAFAQQNQFNDSKHLLDLIIERESVSSTFLPNGIAIPHARLSEISEIKLMLGVIPQGFRQTPDSSPIYLIFLFFSPANETEFGRHLKLLASISAIFRDPSSIQEVASRNTPSEIFLSIQRKEQEVTELG